MRRLNITPFLLVSITVAVFFNLSNAEQPTAPRSVVWSDGFETYATGSFPSTWTPDGNATDGNTNYVTADVSSQGTKSLQLHGSIGGCWAAIAYRPLTISPPFEVEVAVRNGSESLSGCNPDRAGMNVRQGFSWPNPLRELIHFWRNGNITSSGGTVLQTYSTLTWYTIRVRYERPSSTQVRLSYWINGVFRGEETLTADAQEDQMTNFELYVLEGTAWFDDVIVYQEVAPYLVPTLSEWGLIILCLLFIGTAVWYLRRRKIASAAISIFLLLFTLSFYFSSTL